MADWTAAELLPSIFHSNKKLRVAEFDWPFDTALDKHNRWVKLSDCIPWNGLAESYWPIRPTVRAPTTPI